MILLAAVWGFAEATVFFIVPDVAISLATLRHGWRTGLLTAFAAGIGAALGGFATMLFTRHDPAAAERVLAMLPAIDAAMIRRVREAFAANGLGAALAGSVSGIPYKIYAVAAAEAGRSPLAFAAATPFLRLPRFLLTVALTAAARRLLPERTGAAVRLALLAAFWTAFYALYFSRMP